MTSSVRVTKKYYNLACTDGYSVNYADFAREFNIACVPQWVKTYMCAYNTWKHHRETIQHILSLEFLNKLPYLHYQDLIETEFENDYATDTDVDCSDD